MLREAVTYSRMALGLYRHLRSPLNPDPAGTMRRLMRDREENFLAMCRRLVSDPKHPYAQLFDAAGCAYGDVEDSVRRRGLEPTLEQLLDAGVYLTHDEFRGRKEIVRGGRHIPSTSASWDNGATRGVIQNISSSSSGDQLTTRESIAYHRYLEDGILLFMKEFDLAGRSTTYIAPILPAGYGVGMCMVMWRLRLPIDRWYAIGASSGHSLPYRALTRAMVAQLRLFGAKVPYPTYIAPNDYLPAAEFLARRRREGARISIGGMLSTLTRIATAAMDAGLDISGGMAFTAGEALTDVKRRVLEDAGLIVYPTYGASEVGNIGFPCRQMSTGNCVHVFRGGMALLSRPAGPDGPADGSEVLHATTLLPVSPRSLINAQIGDTGIIEKTACDCDFSRLGFDLQVRNIAGIAKVNAQGMTMHVSDLVRLLEEAMPARFGGHPGDYQLLEIDGAGQTEMVLRIHPRVRLASTDGALQFFLQEASRFYGGALTVRWWTESKSIRAEIAEPVLARTGKFRAIRLMGPGVVREKPADSLSRLPK